MKKAVLFLLFLSSLVVIGQEDWKLNVDSLCIQSFQAYGDHQFEKAQELADLAAQISTQKKYQVGLLKSDFYKTIATQELNPSTFDPKAIESLIPKFREAELNIEVARAHTFLAGVYAFFGDIERAIQNHLNSLSIYENLQDTLGIASVHTNLSLVYYDQQDYDEAFRHARISLALNKKEGDPRRLHSSVNNLAIIFENTGPIDSAIFYHQQALDIAHQIKNPYSIGLSLSNLGNNYAIKGQLELAESTLLEGLRIRDSLGYNRGLAYTHNRLSSLYLQMNQLEKSEAHALKSLENAQTAAELKVIRMAYERLMEIAEKKSNPINELKYLKLATELKDSILNESNTKEITQMMANYAFEKEQLLDSIQNAQLMREQSLLYEERLKVERNQRLIFMVTGVLLLVLAVGWWRRYKFIMNASKIIQHEKERSDTLLLNILPAKVAEELKEKGKSEARVFENVTVIFTDFADFTKKAQHLTAKELVNELNICFKAFDLIMEECGLEKIKTIGDAYLAVGGLNGVSDVYDVIYAALKVKDFIKQRNEDSSIPNKAKFDMRIGINSGPVVAGIVGIKKFQYDIWGDTVNTAQRMEAACGLNKINISDCTYQLIKEDKRFDYQCRGFIEVKGKGSMKMWYVEPAKTKVGKLHLHNGV